MNLASRADYLSRKYQHFLFSLSCQTHDIMATLSGDIHIPPCDRDRCGGYHADIVKALKNSGLNCVGEYPLSKYGY